MSDVVWVFVSIKRPKKFRKKKRSTTRLNWSRTICSFTRIKLSEIDVVDVDRIYVWLKQVRNRTVPRDGILTKSRLVVIWTQSLQRLSSGSRSGVVVSRSPFPTVYVVDTFLDTLLKTSTLIFTPDRRKDTKPWIGHLYWSFPLCLLFATWFKRDKERKTHEPLIGFLQWLKSTIVYHFFNLNVGNDERLELLWRTEQKNFCDVLNTQSY